MMRRPFGNTGLEVSAIGLGTVEIGMPYGVGPDGAPRRPDEAEAARLLHRALDAGINFLDTARAYGESEAIIGRALRDRRREYVLASKVLPGPRDQVLASIRESFRCLQTDCIDVFMIHSSPPDADRHGEMMEILAGLKKSGAIRFTGASVYGEEAALPAIQAGCDCLEIAYSAFDRRPEARVFEAAEKAGVAVIARSVLLRGALTDRVRHFPAALAPLRAAQAELARLADGGSVLDLAYRYALSRVPPHTVLAGAASLDELEDALRAAAGGPLPPDSCARVAEIRVEPPELVDTQFWPR
jgi:aryl-alcohol dehydrogenase-like predicted oxidoreductase